MKIFTGGSTLDGTNSPVGGESYLLMSWAKALAWAGHDVYSSGFLGHDTKTENLTFLECNLGESSPDEYDVAIISSGVDVIPQSIASAKVKAKLYIVLYFAYYQRYIHAFFDTPGYKNVVLAHPFTDPNPLYNPEYCHSDKNKHRDSFFAMPIPLCESWGKSHCDRKLILWPRKSSLDIPEGAWRSHYAPMISGAAKLAMELGKELCFTASHNVPRDTARIKECIGKCPFTVHPLLYTDKFAEKMENTCMVLVSDATAERGCSQTTALAMGVLPMTWSAGLAASSMIESGWVYSGGDIYEHLKKVLCNPVYYDTVLTKAQTSLSDHLYSGCIAHFNKVIEYAKSKEIL